MKINVEINNPAGAAANKKFAEKIAATVIENEAARFGDIGQVEASVIFVSPAKIRELNKKYRDVDCATDVLSFAGDGIVPSSAKGDGPACGNDCWSLGELVICAAQVKADAKELKTPFAKELAGVIVHGILHLFGYDHETGEAAAVKMRKQEQHYLSKIKL